MYKVVLDPRASNDVQQVIDYYEDQALGLGRKFDSALHEHLVFLTHSLLPKAVSGNPLPAHEKFPYMIHYLVDEVAKLVIFRSVFSTKADPENWQKRKN